MKFSSISPKQAEIFTFPHEDYDALLCDGAVRSGKSSMMTIAFVEWAMHRFDGFNFGIAGKTVRSAERNLILPLLSVSSMTRKYRMKYKRSLSMMTVEYLDKINYFYIFGGKDESSYTLIQGITLAGVLFDEVALMPQSFVEQGISRTLSVDDAKLWFNCNPEHPEHWFYKEWIQQPEKHRAKHLHFLMSDNPGLSEKALERAASAFSGVFYNRAVLGEWVKTSGLIFSMFDRLKHTFTDEDAPQSGRYFISVDYGTANPFSAGLWCISGRVAYRIREYYYDSRKEGKQLTDEEYADAISQLAGNLIIQNIVVDPSAASFIICLHRRGWRVWGANNDVIPGIRNVSSALQYGRILIHKDCKDLIREMGLYSWDEKAHEDKPIKEFDHACDDARYFVRTILLREFRIFDEDSPDAWRMPDDQYHMYWTGKKFFNQDQN